MASGKERSVGKKDRPTPIEGADSGANCAPEPKEATVFSLGSDPLVSSENPLISQESASGLNAKPRSRIGRFFKEYLPVLTPVAALAVSIVGGYLAYKSNEKKDENASINTYSATRNEMLSAFEKQTDQKARLTEATKIAADGDRALEAAKFVLGAENELQRSGGVLVVEQIYNLQTVDQKKVVNVMLNYYDKPLLRRGVLEWLAEMALQLPKKDSSLFFERVKKTFGADGGECEKQDEQVALAAANFLFIWSFPDSKDLELGLVENCKDKQAPDRFARARDSAINALPRLAGSLSKEERDSIVTRLREFASTSPEETKAKIEQAVAKINGIGKP